MSTFSGLTNALRSLNAQQYALAVTGDNMANANTPGYTRKSADIKQVGVVVGVSRLFATQEDYSGTATANTASRLNNLVLDNRMRVEQGLNTYAAAKQTTLDGVQTIFDEPSDNGLSEQLNDFWTSWSNLANSADPTDPSVQNSVLEKASNVVATLNAASTELSNQQASASQSLTSTVSSINTAAAQVAVLNSQIKLGTASGTDVNDLQDQRDALLVKLSELSGATASPQPDGTVTVTLPPLSPSTTPVTLVAGAAASTTATSGTSPTVGITVGGTAIGSTTGQLQGDLDAVNTTIPGYIAALDTVASNLATAVNTAQAAGFDNSSPSVAGTAMFTGTTAATITVAIASGTLLATSSTAGTKDTSNAAAIARLGGLSTSADTAYRTMIDTLGSASAAATQAATVQQSVTTSVDNLQQSASGVNYDEETNNILVFQRAYQASSRVLTTVDDMLDQLINHTGRVGL